MKRSNIPEANRLEKAINEATNHLNKWQAAVKITDNSLDCSFSSGNNGWSFVSTKYINFEVCKALSIQGFTIELAELEKQLAALD